MAGSLDVLDDAELPDFAPAEDDHVDLAWTTADAPVRNDDNIDYNTAAAYASMLFDEKSAYVARFDGRTWVVEGVVDSVPQ
ncbi:hypothetical protein OC835_007694, partial [Tilletia horrida]